MRNIVLIGFPGSGKTTFGRELANRLDRRFIDLDSVIEAKEGRKISEIFKAIGEKGFRELEAKAVLEVSQENRAVIASGGGVVLNEVNMQLLANNSVIVFLNRSVECIAENLDTQTRPLLADNPTRLNTLYKERLPLYEKYADFEAGKNEDMEKTLSELVHIGSLDLQEKRFSVIGSPIAHSLSPDIHMPVLERFYKTVSYNRINVNKNQLCQWIDQVRKDKIDGFNVTMPNKTEIIQLLDVIDEEASALQSVNTVVNNNGELRGYNTDGQGFTLALKENGASFLGKRVTIIGAGGAGGSIAIKAAKEGAGQINILARNPEQARMISNRVEKEFGVSCPWYESLNPVQPYNVWEADIVINATPLGMTGVKEDFTHFGFLDQLNLETLLCDLVYSPIKTRLLAEGEKRGLRTIGGLQMLIYQALLADQLYMQAELKMHNAYVRVLHNLRGKVELS